MEVFASSVANNVANGNAGRMASQVVDTVTRQADVIANMLGVSSALVLVVAIWIMIKVGKKAVSAILFVIAIILACIFFFGKDAVYQVWSWFANMLGMV